MLETNESKIDVQEAISTAKAYIGKLFKSDGAINIGLEEVAFDELENCWRITVGFTRPWDTTPLKGGIATSFLFPGSAPRTYKVVGISAVDGKVTQITNRPV